MRRLIVFLLGIAVLAMGGLQERPRDPWVFRCVLDKQPRMVVVALHEHLWVAYDATTCTLYKAWDGDVKFQGAVYDDIHGPQPESRGTTLLQSNDDKGWGLEDESGNFVPVTPVWRGYRFQGDQVHLQFDLPFPDGSIARIREYPEVNQDEDGVIRLTRRFECSGSTDGRSIMLNLPDDSKIEGEVRYFVNNSELKESERRIRLDSGSSVLLTMAFPRSTGDGQ
ncbi:MAG: hypothetical protein O7G85_00900 [Planctomycetota bacterium]|nr:hypothetical protein [Planctomycetota bacterium]